MIGHGPVPFVPDAGQDRLRWSYWWLSAVGLLIAVIIGDLTIAGPDTVPPAWTGSAIAFTWLTLTWRGALPHLDRDLLLTIGGIFTATTLGHLLCGIDPVVALRLAGGCLLQGLLQAWMYRTWRAIFQRGGLASKAQREDRNRAAVLWVAAWRREWSPVSVRDLVMLVVASMLGAFLVLPIGVTDGLWLGGAPDGVVLRSALRGGSVMFVGSLGIMLAFQQYRPEELRQPKLYLLIPLVLASALALQASLEGGRLPITWLMLVPSVYVGITFRPWAVGVHALGVGILAMWQSTLPRFADTFEAQLPPEVVVGLLSVICVFVATTLSLLTVARTHAVSEFEIERETAQRQADLLHTVFNAMRDGLVLTNPEGHVSLSNRSARLLLGKPLPLQQPLSEWPDYFNLRHASGAPADGLETLTDRQEDEDVANVTLQIDNEGSNRMLSIGSRTVMGDGAEPELLLLISDVSAEHERVGALTRFAGSVAHDLRSPLTGLEGWLELAEECLENGDSADALRMVQRSRIGATRMKQVIEDWLDYAVTRDGTLRPTQVSLPEVIEMVIAAHRGAEDEGPAFVVNSPHTVFADPAMTRQLVHNLIVNAIKYARPGVAPRVQITSRQLIDLGQIEVSVADQGQGIPPGEEKAIFEEFRRSSRHQTDDAGTGLGLALCQRVVHRHGGQIWARNNVDGGATFTFTLPAVSTP